MDSFGAEPIYQSIVGGLGLLNPGVHVRETILPAVVVRVAPLKAMLSFLSKTKDTGTINKTILINYMVYAWSCQNVCDDLLLENIFIQFGTKLYKQVVGIPIGSSCAPLIADLFLC